MLSIWSGPKFFSCGNGLRDSELPNKGVVLPRTIYMQIIFQLMKISYQILKQEILVVINLR